MTKRKRYHAKARGEGIVESEEKGMNSILIVFLSKRYGSKNRFRELRVAQGEGK